MIGALAAHAQGRSALEHARVRHAEDLRRLDAGDRRRRGDNRPGRRRGFGSAPAACQRPIEIERQDGVTP